MSWKVIKSFLAILILLVGTVQIIPNNVEAIGDPVVNLRWDEGKEVQHANVAPGDSGNVAFTGTVSADIPAGGAFQDIIVNLRVSSEHGWSSSIEPSTILLDPGTEEAPFTVVVKVPPETSYYIDATIMVDGTAQPFPGSSTSEIDPLYGTIKIQQYYRFSLGSETEYIETSPGTDVIFELEIMNEGNARDKFSCEVANLDEITRNGFDVELSHSMVEIPEKGRLTIKISISVPEGSKGLGKTNIELKVNSEAQPQNERIYQNFVFTVKVTEDNIFLTTEFWSVIIGIIIIAVCVIIFWKYKKRHDNLKNY